jgi:hypothetical protein
MVARFHKLMARGMDRRSKPNAPMKHFLFDFISGFLLMAGGIAITFLLFSL